MARRATHRAAAIATVAVSVVGAAAVALPAAGRANDTPVAVAAATQWTVVAAGDIACSPDDPGFNGGAGTARRCHQRATADLAASMSPDDVLVLGDVQYDDGALADFGAVYEPTWGRFDDIVHPVAGNHEYGTPGAAGYFDYFGSRAGTRGQGWYSYDEAGWHIVVLNSSCGKVGGCSARSPQGRWLAADLAANPGSCLLAAWHHPRFSSSNQGGVANVQALWAMLQGAGADLVLNGHRHHYERFAPMGPTGAPDPTGGTVEIVSGGGGGSLGSFGSTPLTTSVARIRAFGVVVVDLTPAGYTARFVNEQGVTLDASSRTC